MILDAAENGKGIQKISEDLEKVYTHCVKSIEKNSSAENVEIVANVGSLKCRHMIHIMR